LETREVTLEKVTQIYQDEIKKSPTNQQVKQAGKKSKTKKRLKGEYPCGNSKQPMAEDIPVWSTMSALDDANYPPNGTKS